VQESRLLFVKAYQKSSGEVLDFTILPMPQGRALALANELSAQVYDRVILSQVLSRLQKEGRSDIFLEPEWYQSVDALGISVRKTGASPDFNRALTATRIGVWSPEDPTRDGVVMLGAIRFAPLKTDPRTEPLPDFRKANKKSLSVTAIKDFLTAHLPLSRYHGRLNLYAGNFQDIELGEVVRDVREEISDGPWR